MMRIYLDDVRPIPEGWEGARSYHDAIDMLKTYDVNEISLDHDLGTEETGYDVLLWIEEQVALTGYRPPEIKIHTSNSSARIKMEAAVLSIKKIQKNS